MVSWAFHFRSLVGRGRVDRFLCQSYIALSRFWADGRESGNNPESQKSRVQVLVNALTGEVAHSTHMDG